MSRRYFILGVLILLTAIVVKSLFVSLRQVKVDKFVPVSAIFLIDSSASNQKNLEKEKKFLNRMCAVLDPEDQVKILNVSQDAYIIYEGNPHNTRTINKTMDAFTQYQTSSYGTAYGSALKKAMGHALNMQKEGYTPAIIVMGDLADEGDLSGQINWKVFPKNVRRVQKYAPGISMTFLFAHPIRLDYVKEKLTPVLGEKRLVTANDEDADKVIRKFTAAIGR